MEQSMSRTSLLYGATAFYDGLIFLAKAHTPTECEEISEMSSIMSKMERFVQIGKHNCEHKMFLLEAEIKGKMGDHDEASR
eukprot:10385974-Ditylum_brightwellii.AAC.1